LISTVTVTTITTITTIAALGLTATISIAAIITLIAFLTTKELAGAGGSSSSMRVGKYLSVGVIPLLMAFAAVVGVKIAEVLA
jgi:hypothetical protein